jgi:hypothetical protein
VEGGGQLGGVEGDGIAGGLGQPQELLGRQHPHGELAATGGDLGFTGLEAEGDGARLQGPHDVGAQPGRDDTHTVADAADRGLDLHGQVEIGSGQVQHVARHFEANAGERGEGTTPRGRGPRRDGQGVEEDVTFGSELHSFTFGPSLTLCRSKRKREQ